MSDFEFRHLKKYKTGGTDAKMELSVPIPSSASGKTYRECPNKSCSPRLFQMGAAPHNRSVADEHKSWIQRGPGVNDTTCPYCAHVESDKAFVAAMDLASATDQVTYAVRRDVHDWMSKLARDFNRKSSGGFLSMSMKVTSPPPSPPIAIREDLLRDLVCSICSRSYGVYAIALFCPDCGAPALAAHFAREMDLVHRQLELAGTKAELDRELGYRLLGNAHEDVLTAFETAQKTTYRFLVKSRLPERYEELCSQKAIGNSFQSTERSRSLFAELALDPYAPLSVDEIDTLTLNIQKRHVIGHNLSVADDRYNALASDGRPGQTIGLLRDDVEHFAKVTALVIDTLDRELRPATG